MKSFLPYQAILLAGFLLPNLSWAEKPISLWHVHEAHEFISKLTQEFAMQEGVDLEVNAYIVESMKTELMERGRSQNLPDMLLVPADFIGIHSKVDFLELDASWPLDKANQSALDSAVLDGKFYGLPIFQGNHLMLYYNKQWVEQPAATWQAMLQQQNELSPQGVETIVWDFDEMFWFMPFYGAFGGKAVVDGEITLNNDAMVNALTEYKNLFDSGLVRRGCDNQCAETGFKSGKQAYVISGDWALADFKASLGNDLGVAELPAIGENHLVPLSSSYVLVVLNSVAPNRMPTIRKYSEFLMSFETQVRTYEKTKLLPTNTQAFEAVTHSSNEIDRYMLKQLAHSQGMAIDPAMGITWEVMAHSFRRFMDQGFSARRTAKYMQDLADSVVKQKAEH